MSRLTVMPFLVMVLLLAPSAIWAQEGTEGTEGTGNTENTNSQGTGTTEGGGAGDAELDEGAEAFLAGEEEAPEIAAPVEEQGVGREEPPNMAFWMIGTRWRMIMIPEWLLGSFFDLASPTQVPRGVTVNQAGGVEFTWRRNRLSIIGAVWWAGFFTQSDSANAGPATDGWFVAEERGSRDDPEFIKSEINLLLFTVDFVHSYMFNEWIGITYGGGLGFGINLHSDGGTGLYRREAEGPTGGPYELCNPPPYQGQCESDGYYYPAQDDRVWRAYPWINILLGLRFKPHRHVEINVDGGVGLGFLFGARLNYIF